MTEESDADLVEKSRRGDRRAFAELVRRHQDRVYHLAYRMTQSSADAADLSQETFLRAYRKLHRYRPGHSVRNWLLAICANLTKNMFRTRTRQRQADAGHAELRGLEAPEHGHPDRPALEMALARLDPTERAAVTLHYIEGLSFPEVAEILHLRLSAAKMRVHRGLRRMHHDLERTS